MTREPTITPGGDGYEANIAAPSSKSPIATSEEKPSKDRKTQPEIELRREAVAKKLETKGWSLSAERELAVQFGVNRRQIRRDKMKVEAQLRLALLPADLESAKAEHLAKVRGLYARLRPKAANGNMKAAGVCAQLLKHEAAILGLNAPILHEINDLRGRSKTALAEEEAEINAILGPDRAG